MCRCCAGLRCAWWLWGWDVGAAGGALSPPKVSMCPQRAPRGPTVGSAATTGKLRQGALYPQCWLYVPGCVPVATCDPWQQGGLYGYCLTCRLGLSRCPWGCVWRCMAAHGCTAVLGQTCGVRSAAWAQVDGPRALQFCWGDWGWVGVLWGCWGSVVVFRGVRARAGCARVVMHMQGCAVVWLSPGWLFALAVGYPQGSVKLFL